MPGTNEAFSRVKIDAQLKDQGWDVLNPNAVRFEYVLPDKTEVIERLEELNLLLPPLEAQRAFAPMMALLSCPVQERVSSANCMQVSGSNDCVRARRFWPALSPKQFCASRMVLKSIRRRFDFPLSAYAATQNIPIC